MQKLVIEYRVGNWDSFQHTCCVQGESPEAFRVLIQSTMEEQLAANDGKTGQNLVVDGHQLDFLADVLGKNIDMDAVEIRDLETWFDQNHLEILTDEKARQIAGCRP